MDILPLVEAYAIDDRKERAVLFALDLTQDACVWPSALVHLAQKRCRSETIEPAQLVSILAKFFRLGLVESTVLSYTAMCRQMRKAAASGRRIRSYFPQIPTDSRQCYRLKGPTSPPMLHKAGNSSG